MVMWQEIKRPETKLSFSHIYLVTFDPLKRNGYSQLPN